MTHQRMHFITLMTAFRFKEAYELYTTYYREYQTSELSLWDFLRTFAKETCRIDTENKCAGRQEYARATSYRSHQYLDRALHGDIFACDNAIAYQIQTAKEYANARKLLLTLLE